MGISKKNILKKYFSEENIRLAFNRYERSTSNFRNGIDRAALLFFKSDLDNNIQKLSKLLLDDKFSPSVPLKYFLPKKTPGLYRTTTVLSVEDGIVYQCIIDNISYFNYDLLKSTDKFAFAYRLSDFVRYDAKSLLSKKKNKNADLEKLRYEEGGKKFSLMDNWRVCYAKFSAQEDYIVANHKKLYVLQSDISSFYDGVSHDILRKKLINNFSVDENVVNILFACLNCWSGLSQGDFLPGIGLPQGPQPSAFLAELFLMDLDQFFIDKSPLGYLRYVDDFRIYQSSKEDVLKSLACLDIELKKIGLSINSQKTNINNLSKKEEKIKVLKKKRIGLPSLVDFGSIVDERTFNNIEKILGGNMDVKGKKRSMNPKLGDMVVRDGGQDVPLEIKNYRSGFDIKDMITGKVIKSFHFSDIDLERDFDKHNNLSLSTQKKYYNAVKEINDCVAILNNNFLKSDNLNIQEFDDLEKKAKKLSIFN